jgi:CHAD domain-containing protein
MKSRPARYVWQDSRSVQTLIRALRTQAPLVAEPTGRMHGLWLDSFDGRLYRHGYALCYEPGPDAGLLSWGRWPDGPPVHTLTATGPPRFPSDLPASPLRDVLVGLLDVRALLPLVAVQHRTHPFRLLNPHGKTIARLVLAAPGQASAPQHARQPVPGFVQVWPLKGYGAEVEAVMEVLTAHLSLEAVKTSPLEAALAAMDLRPDAGFFPTRIRLAPDEPAFEALRRLLRPLLTVMRLNEPGLVAGLDMEFLHDYRVALRRTRSALGQMKAVFPPIPLARFQQGFKWLSDLTGPARDLDVYLLWITGYQHTLAEPDHPALEPLVGLLREKQSDAHTALCKALQIPRYRRLLRDWQAFLDGPSPEDLPKKSSQPLLVVASRRLARLYERVIEQGEAVTDATPAEVLHQLRITCKKLRYLVEFFRDLYPARHMNPLLRTLKQVQENLGATQDLAVQRTWLHDLDEELAARGLLSEATHRQIAHLMETLDTQQQAARATFPEAFARFARSRPPRPLRKAPRPA